MKLYIQIINNEAVNHPILEENLLMFFSEDSLISSTEYAPFDRVPPPSVAVYDKLVNTYELVGKVYTDVWTVVHMNEQEVLEKQDQAKLEWKDAQGYASWKFNEITCSFYPPVPHPQDDRQYEWSEETITWIEITS